MASKPRSASAGASLHSNPAAAFGAAGQSLEAQLYHSLQQAGCLEKSLLLAFSGGLDSRVLLQLLVTIRPHAGFNLHAMHIHHGLSPHAGYWADFCTAVCEEHNVPLELVRVAINRNDKRGIEAAARAARYQALLATDADYVLLAHHEDDQAETLLLQLLRGAGAKGLAAMSALDTSKRLLRPLLATPRAMLQQYAEQHDLRWVDDESNSETAYDRNYCRHEIFPVLLSRFPAAKSTLARSATHIAEAAQLLDALAAIDAESIIVGSQLRVSGLAALSDVRARNLLRWWLSAHQQQMPSAAMLQEVLRQLISARVDAEIRLKIDSVSIMRYRDTAYLEKISPEPVITADATDRTWRGERELQLADGSRLIFEPSSGTGLAIERLGIAELRIVQRHGGERFKPDAARPTRTLKNLMQEAGIPPWQRARLPLIYWEETLAVVPGIGVASSLQATSDEPGLTVTWQP